MKTKKCTATCPACDKHIEVHFVVETIKNYNIKYCPYCGAGFKSNNKLDGDAT